MCVCVCIYLNVSPVPWRCGAARAKFASPESHTSLLSFLHGIFRTAGSPSEAYGKHRAVSIAAAAASPAARITLLTAPASCKASEQRRPAWRTSSAGRIRGAPLAWCGAGVTCFLCPARTLFHPPPTPADTQPPGPATGAPSLRWLGGRRARESARRGQEESHAWNWARGNGAAGGGGGVKTVGASDDSSPPPRQTIRKKGGEARQGRARTHRRRRCPAAPTRLPAPTCPARGWGEMVSAPR